MVMGGAYALIQDRFGVTAGPREYQRIVDYIDDEQAKGVVDPSVCCSPKIDRDLPKALKPSTLPYPPL